MTRLISSINQGQRLPGYYYFSWHPSFLPILLQQHCDYDSGETSVDTGTGTCLENNRKLSAFEGGVPCSVFLTQDPIMFKWSNPTTKLQYRIIMPWWIPIFGWFDELQFSNSNSFDFIINRCFLIPNERYTIMCRHLIQHPQTNRREGRVWPATQKWSVKWKNGIALTYPVLVWWFEFRCLNELLDASPPVV